MQNISPKYPNQDHRKWIPTTMPVHTTNTTHMPQFTQFIQISLNPTNSPLLTFTAHSPQMHSLIRAQHQPATEQPQRLNHMNHPELARNRLSMDQKVDNLVTTHIQITPQGIKQALTIKQTIVTFTQTTTTIIKIRTQLLIINILTHLITIPKTIRTLKTFF